MPKSQAENDLWHVIQHLRRNKARCSSLQGVTDVRKEAVKTLAKIRSREKDTIDRNLKFAVGVDKEGGMASVDIFLFQQLWGDNNEQR